MFVEQPLLHKICQKKWSVIENLKITMPKTMKNIFIVKLKKQIYNLISKYLNF